MSDYIIPFRGYLPIGNRKVWIYLFIKPKIFKWILSNTRCGTITVRARVDVNRHPEPELSTYEDAMRSRMYGRYCVARDNSTAVNDGEGDPIVVMRLTKPPGATWVDIDSLLGCYGKVDYAWMKGLADRVSLNVIRFTCTLKNDNAGL